MSVPLIHTVTSATTTASTVALNGPAFQHGYNGRHISYMVDVTGMANGSTWAFDVVHVAPSGTNGMVLATKAGVTTTGVYTIPKTTAFITANEDVVSPYATHASIRLTTSTTTNTCTAVFYQVIPDKI